MTPPVMYNCLLALFYFTFSVNNFAFGIDHQKGDRLIERVNDVKIFKKLLRTKTNILVAYCSDSETQSAVKKWLPVLRGAAENAYGRGTIAIVNCNDNDGKKLCKKYKVTPESVLLYHYSNGEFHKEYDRRQSVESMSRFLLDPSGDAPWEEDEQSKDVVHLADAQALQRLLKKEKQPTLIMFYAPWCGHCKRLKPEYNVAATTLKGSHIMAAMDVNRPENNNVQRHFNITGFPTLLYFENGSFKHQYGGAMNTDGLIEWMKDPKAPEEKQVEKAWAEEEGDVIHLTDATFHSFLTENPSVLVMFYAPWCGHCKAMKPDYSKTANRMKTDNVAGHLAAVDVTTNPKLGEEFEIKGFPTVKYFKDGAFAWDLPERNGDKIYAFMKSPTEPPPPPPPEVPWPEMPGHVVHLTTDTFHAQLKKKKHAIVIFYAPWCGHCKAAKPEFSEAASHFKDEPKVMLAAVDCTSDKEICDQYEVRGYPTLFYFSYLKTKEPYTGGRKKDSFISFINDALGDGAAKPEDAPKQPEKAKSEGLDFDPAVHRLDPESFTSTVSAAPRAIIMFYAPWCGHCKRAKQPFSQAAAELAAAGGKLFAAVDCTLHSSFCKDNGVKGYPTIQIWESGKFVEKFSGERSKTGFLTAINSKQTPKTEL